MPSWIAPKTNWTSSDFYNYADLNRVENNTEYLKDYFSNLGYVPSTTTITTNRTKASIEYFDSLNRIESNIKAIKEASFEPVGWIEPYTTWVSVSKIFSYVDANRLESNLVFLKTMIENIEAEIKICGTFYVGQDFNLGG